MYRFVAYNICNETIQKVSPLNNPLDELFSLYCMKQLKMPPDLQELPQYDALASSLSRKQRARLIDLYDALASSLSRKQRARLIDLFDEFALGFSVYAAECFAQGIRFALSLTQQLYPQE